MAQPNRGGNPPRPTPLPPRGDRTPAGAPADSATETTQEIRRPGGSGSSATLSGGRREPGGEEGFSAPRLSRTASLGAPPTRPAASSAARPGEDDTAPTQTLPRVDVGSPRARGSVRDGQASGQPVTAPTAVPAGAQGGQGGHGAQAAAQGSARRPARASGPRRARLQVRHISPWTVLKFSALLAVALFLVWLIAIGLLYGVLNGAGVIAKINDTYSTISGAGSTPPITTGLIFSGALVVGAVGAVVFVALSTLGAIIYNLCADVVGGIELTLAERE